MCINGSVISHHGTLTSESQLYDKLFVVNIRLLPCERCEMFAISLPLVIMYTCRTDSHNDKVVTSVLAAEWVLCNRLRAG